MIDLKLPKDWEKRKIGDIAAEISERNDADDDLPVLSCTKHDGLVDSLKYFKRRVFSEDISKYKVVPRNCFAYATNHIEEGSIGYQDTYDRALISPIYTVFRTKPEMDDAYLFYLFKTELYRHIFEINTSASVDRRGSLRWKEFSQIAVPVPPFIEQEKIAEILLAWDRAIETMDKLIDAKTRLKKGLMQKLLTGKVRFKEFKEKWRHLKLADVCEIQYGKSQKGLPSGKYKIYGTGGVVGFTSAYLYDKPSVLIGRKGTIDTPIYVDEPFYPIDTIFYVKPKNDVSPKFLYYQLGMKNLKRYNEASGVPSLNRETLYRIGINMTSEKEQELIADILSAVDRELECLSGIQAKMKSQKNGLMQKLLTGKIRVKI